VYVNKQRDIFFFGHHWSLFWLLRTTIMPMHATYAEQIARLQHMAQLSGCRNIAFKYSSWARAMMNPLLFLESFECMRTAVLVLDTPNPPPPLLPPRPLGGTSSRYQHAHHWPGPRTQAIQRWLSMRPLLPIPRNLMAVEAETRFVVPTEKILKAGGWTDLKGFERKFDDLRGREEELRISIPRVEAVVSASKDIVTGNWARGLAVYAI
jgi:hypothetical protein